MKRFLEKIDEWISTHIKLDDALHFIAGWIIANVLYMVLIPYFGFEVDFHLVSALALVGAVIVGLAKEIIDTQIKKQAHSNRDWVATIIGGLVGIAFMEAFKAMNIFVDMYIRETIMNNWVG